MTPPLTLQYVRDGLVGLGPIDGAFTLFSVLYTSFALVAVNEGLYAIAFACFCLALFEATLIGDDVGGSK